MALAAGAYGGLITPSMMLGSTISFAAAAAWNSVFPEMPSESAAVVGAAVFLGVSLKMPLTAIVFVLELTYAPLSLLLPLCIGMAGHWEHREKWASNECRQMPSERFPDGISLQIVNNICKNLLPKN